MTNKRIQKLRILIATCAIILYLAGFLGFFYPIKLFDINIAPLIQRVLVDFTILTGILLISLFIITAIFGRIYCSTLCPLGLFQELCLLLFHRNKLPKQKNLILKYFILSISFGTLLGGTCYILKFIDPYTIFGSALSGTTLNITILGVIAIITALYGRWFCTNLCPVGAILGIISRHAYNKIYIRSNSCAACGLCAPKCPSGCIDFKSKTVNNETCIKCFKCLSLCHNQGITYGHQTEKKITLTPAFSSSRRRFIVATATLATLAIAYKTGLRLSSNIAQKTKALLLPPGARNKEEFANNCLNCNLCVENCPMKIIKKADSTYPTIHLELDKNFCSFNCNKCSNICPSGALHRLSIKKKQRTQIGFATINHDICVQCGLCVRECPRSAITKQHGEFPNVNTDMCIGCGACHAVCPANAIKIVPISTQKTLSK